MEGPDEANRAARPSLAERILCSLPGLTRFVRRRMGPELAARESASDIVQSTCRELLRAGSSFEDRGEASFQRWVQAAAEHKLQNRARHWRAQRRAGTQQALVGGTGSDDEAFEPEAPGSARPSQDAMLREEAQRLERAFRALTPEYRSVLQRSQIDGASHAEIASELGRTTEAARKLVARALARLSAALEPNDDQSGEIERAGRKPVL
ncbi:MAG: sigma-70 family RNA polymerase sigma factor [Planctomycetes bacterium]|nr:sigma-70 family RNA polymerase sigma factor [Planctomycetota bacterium]